MPGCWRKYLKKRNNACGTCVWKWVRLTEWITHRWFGFLFHESLWQWGTIFLSWSLIYLSPCPLLSLLSSPVIVTLHTLPSPSPSTSRFSVCVCPSLPPLRQCFTEHVNGKMSMKRRLMAQRGNTQKFVENEIGYLRVYTSVALRVTMWSRLHWLVMRRWMMRAHLRTQHITTSPCAVAVHF